MGEDLRRRACSRRGAEVFEIRRSAAKSFSGPVGKCGEHVAQRHTARSIRAHALQNIPGKWNVSTAFSRLSETRTQATSMYLRPVPQHPLDHPLGRTGDPGVRCEPHDSVDLMWAYGSQPVVLRIETK